MKTQPKLEHREEPPPIQTPALTSDKWSSNHTPVLRNKRVIKNQTSKPWLDEAGLRKYQEIVPCEKDDESVSNWDESEMGDDETDRQKIER